MNYLFPASGIFLTAIPKNASNTTLNFFLKLELFLTGEIDSLQANIDNFSAVHIEQGPVLKYSVEKDFGISNDVIRILVTRDPLDRAISGWLDKCLFLRDTNFIYNEHFSAFNCKNFESLQECKESFYSFLELLKNDDYLQIDQHFRPQVNFFDGDFTNALIMDHKDLKTLPRLLSMKHPRFKSIQEIRLPYFNSFGSPLARVLNTSQSRLIAKEIYMDDYVFLESHGLGNMEGNYSDESLDFQPIHHMICSIRSRTLGLGIEKTISAKDEALRERDLVIESQIWRKTLFWRKLRDKF